MWLRSSTTSYSGFNLDMDRSPGFGPAYTDFRAFHTRFRCGSAPEALNLASTHSSPDRSTKSTRSQWTRSAHFPRHGERCLRPLEPCFACLPKYRHSRTPRFPPGKSVEHAILLPQLVGTAFQVLFHSPPGVLFTFPSQYSALSVTEEYLALRGGPRLFAQGSTCLELLRIPLATLSFRLHDSHVLWSVFPVPFC